MNRETFTLTFGDQAENHVGMQKLGSLADHGFSFQDLCQAQDKCKNVQTELHRLNDVLDKDGIETKEVDDAHLLIIRRGIDLFGDPDEFFAEQSQLMWDKRAKMYGRVVDKHARHNLCFSEESQDPDYEQGKGRIIAFDQVPLLYSLRKSFAELISGGENLVVEGNHYYDIAKCGIGFHGDSERRKVIGVRLGATIPLEFQWFFKGKAVGKRISFQLNHGDIYIMSEKTVGTDWKKINIYTLRHAAGAAKFLKI